MRVAVDLDRVKRWFGGGAGGGAAAPAAPDSAASPVAVPPSSRSVVTPLPAWHAERVALAEKLWGEGFVRPGGAEEVLHLVNPMGLSGADTLLLLGAGPFGAAHSVANARKCWVEGYERDPDLLALAQHRAEMAGLQKRAPTHPLSRWLYFERPCDHIISE